MAKKKQSIGGHGSVAHSPSGEYSHGWTCPGTINE